MLRQRKAALVALLAALVVATAASMASGNELSTSESSFRVVWSGATERLKVHAIGLTIECDVTLSGSFTTRTFVKSRGARIASITAARRENCAQGNVYTILSETLPWSMNYEGFAGTLPRVERIDATIVGAGILYPFSLMFREFLCLARFTRESPWLVRITLVGGAVTRWSTPTSSAPANPECNGLSLEGSAAMTAAAGSELRVTLI
jgi:hypothetical protein